MHAWCFLMSSNKKDVKYELVVRLLNVTKVTLMTSIKSSVPAVSYQDIPKTTQVVPLEFDVFWYQGCLL